MVVYAGERYDVILTADQPPGVYWLKVHGLMDCDERYTLAHQVAVLRYQGAEQPVPQQEIDYWSTKRDGRVSGRLLEHKTGQTGAQNGTAG